MQGVAIALGEQPNPPAPNAGECSECKQHLLRGLAVQVTDPEQPTLEQRGQQPQGPAPVTLEHIEGYARHSEYEGDDFQPCHGRAHSMNAVCSISAVRWAG